MLAMQMDNRLTGNQMDGVCHAMRAGLDSRMIFEPNYRQMQAERNKLFTEFFSYKQIESPTLHEPVYGCFCIDTAGYLHRLQEHYKCAIQRVHIGADFGQEFLKIVITIAWQQQQQQHQQQRQQKQQLISDHSRRRALILANVPLLSESHDSLRNVFGIVNFPSDVPFYFVGDLKVFNFVFGLSTNAAAHGCPFCEQSFRHKISNRQQLSSATLRTYANIVSHNADYSDSKSSDPAAGEFFSCCGTPIDLFKGEPDEPLIWKSGLPGLHVMLGGNWLIDEIELLYADVHIWWRRYNYVRPKYHGGAFEGNQMRALLRSSSIAELQQLMKAAPAAISHRAEHKQSNSPTVMLLVDCLVAFAEVVDTSFGKMLRPGWREAIHGFKKSVLRLPAAKYKRVTIKFHLICCHLEPWCSRHDAGLAAVHEQTLEASHRDFMNLWSQSYSYTNCTVPKFGDSITRCTVAYNTQHVPIMQLPGAAFVDRGRCSELKSTGADHIHEGPKSSTNQVCLVVFWVWLSRVFFVL